jgi:hypothetical protein
MELSWERTGAFILAAEGVLICSVVAFYSISDVNSMIYGLICVYSIAMYVLSIYARVKDEKRLRENPIL